jgi:hypothetical protein
MSGSFHSYKTPPSGVNFEFDVEKYGNSYGKVAGVGCDGTKSGVDATLPKYSSPFIVGGSTGYSFTDVPVGPVAGPNAPYSEIEKYDNTKVKYRNDFAPEFPSLLTGGKSRKRKVQYGCSKKTRGGKKSRKNRTRRHKHKRSIRRRSSSKRSRTVRRRKMRGGMSSASDYTQGRDTSQDQPYGNKAYSFGQGLSSMLSANESALASPPPFLPYNDCGKYTRH